MKDVSTKVELDVLIGELAEEYGERLRGGEKPDVEEYARRHPEVADQIRRILPALEIMGEVPDAVTHQDKYGDADDDKRGLIGEYRIVREVGRGGMGVVYEAEQLSLSRRVALKVLPFAAVLDERQIQRFRNEALAAAQLDHPHIVDVYGVGCERSVHFYAMRFVEGHTLAEVIAELQTIRRAGDLPDVAPAHAGDSTPALAALSTQRTTTDREFFRSVARIGIEVAEALDHAHQQGVIHRDVKPGNVIIDAAGKSWVTDFGLARVESGATLTMTGDLLGTLRYMSPEQALAKRVVVDHRTDVYSLGITLYELLTLQPAFRDDDRHELLRKISFEEPKPPGKLNHAVPEALETIVLKAIAKNANDRYETAQEFADDLHRFLEDKPIRARRPGPVQIAGQWMRRNSGLVATVAIVFLLTTIAASVAAVLVTQEQSITKEALGDAEEQRDRADRIAEGSRQQLLGIQVARGTELLNEGDPDGLLELVEACRTADAGGELDGLAGYAWAYAHQTWENRLRAVLPGSESIDFSPDGKLFATANGAVANVWDVKTAERIYPPLPMERQISVVAFSPNGRWIATHCVEGVARIWNAANGEPASPLLRHDQLVEFMGPEDHPRSAAFSPDGSLLATCGADGTVCLWSVPGGEVYCQPLPGRVGHGMIAFSPDGRLLAAAAKKNHGATAGVFVWNVETRELHWPPFGPPRKAQGLLFHPNSSEIAVSTTDGQTRWWDLESCELVVEKASPSGHAMDAALSPDGRSYAIADRGWRVDVYDSLAEPSPSRSMRHAAGVRAVDFSPDGRLIASGSIDQTARIWEAKSGLLIAPSLLHQSEVSRIQFSPDGQTLASSGTEIKQKGGSTRLWNVHPKRLPAFCRIPENAGRIALSHDGTVMATITPDKRTFQIWNTSTLEPLSEEMSVPDEMPCSSLAFNITGEILLLALGRTGPDSENHLRMWNIAERRFVDPAIPMSYGGPIAVAVDQSGSRLAVSYSAWRTHVHDVRTGQLLLDLFPQEWPYGTAFSPDGRRLATGTGAGVAQQWDLETGAAVGPPMQHPGSVRSVAYSRDGKLLATVCSDRNQGRYTLYLWFVGWGYPYQHIILPVDRAGPEVETLVGPMVHFDAEGNLLFCGASGQQISIWPMPTLPSDLAEVELKTHLALGLRRSEVGTPEAIRWQQWRNLRTRLIELEN